jgi:ADP-dependent NAD(P)H-hydrate dehydratase / NAD(P)H-hydrate epimerase
MKIVTAEQMRLLDRETIQSGISEKELIGRAGTMAADWISQRYESEFEIFVLAGKGNNGADAVVAGNYLKKKKYKVKIFDLSKIDLRKIQSGFTPKRQTMIIDGVFGTGVNRPLKEPFVSFFSFINSLNLDVIALDIPSGLHPDSGQSLGAVIKARHTLTFGLPKLGLVQEAAADSVGLLHVLDIGFPSKLIEKIRTPYELITPQEAALSFPRRSRTAHKGTLGHVLVIGGSVGFAGAPVMSARAALRTGAGLVSLIVPKEIYPIAASLAGPEVMVHLFSTNDRQRFFDQLDGELIELIKRVDSIVIGPGLGQNPKSGAFLKSCIHEAQVPLVIDADALNLISKDASILPASHRNEVILTPHPVEMARLLKKLPSEVQSNRFKAATDLSSKKQATVILKGARTIIAHSQLQDFQFSINALAGNPGMATAGCGDVLSGILGALLARRLKASEATKAAVYMHARTGDIGLPESGGGIASDLIDALPVAIETISKLSH